MPRYDEWLLADDKEKMEIMRLNLKQNPHIAAYHFHVRFQTFFDEYLSKKFKIKAYWRRYEWQGRGSTHVHGLYWIEGVKQAPDEGFPNTAEKDEFAKTWGLHVTAFNPEPGRNIPIGESNPLASRPGEDTTFRMLSSILNRCQRHHCSESYCLRRFKLPGGKMSEKKSCRFYFERNLREYPVVSTQISRGKNPPWEVFDGVRNDGQMNNHIRAITMGWLANTDAVPCTSLRAVINYISKYCSKAEI